MNGIFFSKTFPVSLFLFFFAFPLCLSIPHSVCVCVCMCVCAGVYLSTPSALVRSYVRSCTRACFHISPLPLTLSLPPSFLSQALTPQIRSYYQRLGKSVLQWQARGGVEYLNKNINISNRKEKQYRDILHSDVS